MKALVIRRIGPPETLCIEKWPDPMPQAQQILIRVKAAGVNFADCMARMGLYNDAPPRPFVPGYEASGIVEKVGRAVLHLKEGDRVFGLTRFSGCAEYAAVDAFQMQKIPDGISFDQAAAIPVNYFTAYAALCEMARVRPGDHVLIHSAAGGVGIAAMQISKHFGANIYATAGSDSKLNFLKSIGADVAVNYRRDDYEKVIKANFFSHKGLDITLNAMGGDSLKKDLRLLGPSGRVIAYGISNMAASNSRDWIGFLRGIITTPIIHPFSLMNENRGIFGLNMLHYFQGPEHYKKISDGLMSLMEAKVINPVVDSTYPLEQAAKAHERIHSRQNMGKVLLIP